MDAALIAARFFHYAALTILFGQLLFPTYAFSKANRETGSRAVGRLRPLLAPTVALALVSAVIWFAATVAQMADDPTAAFNLDVLRMTAASTEFGRVWTARLAALALLALALASPLRRRRAFILSLAGFALASLAATGHARVGEGPVGWLHVAADAVHLLTAGLWIGALPSLAVLLHRSDHDAPMLSLSAVRRFSAVATPAVALLLLTGVVSTVILAETPSTLWTSRWGQLLALKIAAVGIMCGLAAANRWRVTPELSRDPAAGAGRLRRNALAELALSLGVLGIVALLGTLAPTQ